MLSCHILWLLLFQSLALTASSSEHYHIVPVNSTDELCSKYQKGTCFTLEQLVQTDLLSGGDNLTLSFLPGEHILTGEFMIQNISHVLITGLDTTIVSFHGNSRIKLSSLSKLHIKDINFVESGASSDFVVDDSIFLGTEILISKLRSHDLENSKLLIIDTQSAVIENTVFVNNTARALYIEAEDVYIANSEFTANNGGAVHVMSSIATISNTTFSNNRATGGGGATILDSGDVIITKCNLSNNTVYSLGEGGAILAISSYVFISNSTLTNNSADWRGGVIRAHSSNVSISNSTLTNNSADQRGGVIHAYSSNVFISNSTLTNNSADQRGGVIYAHSSNLSISNSTLTNNSADQRGGVICAHSSNLSISNNTLTNNSADQRGGVIHAYSSNVFISNSTLTNNSADLRGGVIYAHSSNLSISNSALTNNSADWGGVIHTYSSNLSISDSTLTNNSADQLGGVIHAHLSNLSISNSTLTNNSADPRGGVIHSHSSNVSISNSTLTNNSADQRGGVIDAASSNVFISNSTLTNNSADRRGGVIGTVSSNVFISNSTLTNNSVNRRGGVVGAISSNVFISNSTLANNSADQRGGVIYADSSNVSISNSTLTNNSADKSGGVIRTYSSNLSISNSTLKNNSADWRGGVIYANSSNVFTFNSTLTNNSADQRGGVIYTYSSNVSISNSTLTNNSADRWGGVIGTLLSNVSISNSTLTKNSADRRGGVIHANSSNLFTFNSTLANNSADKSGGVIYAILSNLSISNSTLTNNSADQGGGVIYSSSSRLTLYSTRIVKNTVKMDNGSTMYLQVCTTTFHGVNTISDNRGHIYAFASTVKFNGQTELSNNSGLLGGAISTEQSDVYFNSTQGILIISNTATTGGGIFLRESTLIVYHKANISHNIAAEYGGGIYALSSRIEIGEPLSFVSLWEGVNLFMSENVTIANNAAQNGGGIYATASNIQISQFYVDIDSNTAIDNGGGMYLERESNIYLLKRYVEYYGIEYKVLLLLNNNSVSQYGGGIFVADDIEGGAACGEDGENNGECFIQTIRLYSEIIRPYYNFFNTFMTNNIAASGSDIFGGLLDRCTASRLAEVSNSNGMDYINKTVASSKRPLRHDLSISSQPVQVLFCDILKNIFVRKGDNFNVSVIAVDQVGNPVNTTIYSSVVTLSGVGRLKEGQAQQTVGNQCTEIEYNVFSQDSSAQVDLYADGPCINFGISKRTMNIIFPPCTCPIGLQPTHNQSDIDCQCDCDPVLQQHGISVCSQEEGTIQLENDPNVWIGIVNTTNGTGYVISDCPFDYCKEKPVNIILSSSCEIDRQCAYNRSGVLCGECQKGLSLMFATSNCQQCSNLFLLLLIPFSLAGIALVAFILLFNITIATGTVYGLIYYANIIAANKATFVPFSNFLTVFISWVNLDLGITTCFYNGMSSQSKVLLQLVFPAYLFLLIFLIIIVSKYSSLFAKLLSTRNPVAALATLILLSYSKLIRFLIAALQYTVLDYPDDKQQVVWLYDGNVPYFAPEHIPRLIAAAIILTAGGLFTVLLLFGQWLPRCSNWELMKWTRNTKYIAFMDAYHSPFTPKHRYWLGLLLFALIAQNITSAMSPHPVLTAACLSVGLIVFKSLNIRVHKSQFNDTLETLFLLNLAILAIGTLKVENMNGNQETLANVSMSIAFVQFVVIVGYHFYEFVLRKNPTLQVNLPKDAIQNRIVKFRQHHPKHIIEQQELAEVWDYEPKKIPPRDDDPDRYITPPIVTPATRPDQLREPALDILAPLTKEDYRQAPPTSQDNRHPLVTHMVIEAIRHDDNVLS